MQHRDNERDEGVLVSCGTARATRLRTTLIRYRTAIPHSKAVSPHTGREPRGGFSAILLAWRFRASLQGSDVATLIRGRQAPGLGVPTIRPPLVLFVPLRAKDVAKQMK